LLNYVLTDFLTDESFLHLLRQKIKNKMGVFNSLFGSKEPKEEKVSYLKWIPLTTLEQLETIKEQSKTEAILVFKHSTRCGISRMVIKQFEGLFQENHQHLKVYYLDLLNYRNVSDELGYTFQVMHQSPQLLVIKNEVSMHDVSHYDITQTNLTRFI
jgi:bacillithiol system protein YtxJ